MRTNAILVYLWYAVPSWVVPKVFTRRVIWLSRLFEKEDSDCVYDKSLGTGSSVQTKFRILDATFRKTFASVSKYLHNSSSPNSGAPNVTQWTSPCKLCRTYDLVYLSCSIQLIVNFKYLHLHNPKKNLTISTFSSCNRSVTIDAIAPPREWPQIMTSELLKFSSLKMVSIGNDFALWRNPEWNLPGITDPHLSLKAWRLYFQSLRSFVPRNAI